MKQYRLGILGLGMIGRVHAYAAGSLPFYYDLPFGVKLAGIYNRTFEKAQNAVTTMGFEFAARTPEELIEREDIDAVSVCLPNHLHEKYAVMALEAGKHLYCEKPIATSYEGALRIQAAADKSGKVAQMVFNNRHFPAVMRAKQLVDEGRLGRLLSFQVMYNHSSNIDPGKVATWRFSQEFSGAGTLADMGSHAIDLLCFLAGPIDKLNAAMQTAFPRRPDGKGGMAEVCVDDAVYMVAQMKNGAMGTITSSKLATGTNDEMDIRLFGEKGALHFNADFPNTLDFYDNTDLGGAYGGSKGFKAIESYQHFEKPGGMPAPRLAIGWLRAHVHSLYTFFNCVHTGASPSPSISDGVYNQNVLDKVVESAETGVWVTL